MAIIKSCCCWRGLRRGCYACSIYTIVYYSVTIVTMSHFLEEERRYLSGEMTDPESESFLQPDKITIVTVSFNILLLVCGVFGFISSFLLIVGLYKDLKYLLLPWIFGMTFEATVEFVNMIYLFYQETVDFNPITSFLFTMDFFMILLNAYATICVISQFQEYTAGRGTAAHDAEQLVGAVQFTTSAPHTTTTGSAPSTKRRASLARPAPSVAEPSTVLPANIPSVLVTRPSKSGMKKHVQFPDEDETSAPEHSTIVIPEIIIDQSPEPDGEDVISSLWVERETAPTAAAASASAAAAAVAALQPTTPAPDDR